MIPSGFRFSAIPGVFGQMVVVVAMGAPSFATLATDRGIA